MHNVVKAKLQDEWSKAVDQSQADSRKVRRNGFYGNQ